MLLYVVAFKETNEFDQINSNYYARVLKSRTQVEVNLERSCRIWDH